MKDVSIRFGGTGFITGTSRIEGVASEETSGERSDAKLMSFESSWDCEDEKSVIASDLGRTDKKASVDSNASADSASVTDDTEEVVSPRNCSIPIRVGTLATSGLGVEGTIGVAGAIVLRAMGIRFTDA